MTQATQQPGADVRATLAQGGSSGPWGLMRTGAGEAAYNMAMDEALLEFMPRLRVPVLRFYGWTQPAATFGYFQKHAEVERTTPLRPLVRRPTGGGIVPHDADWTYSLAFPTHHEWYGLAASESYRRVHEWLQAGFARLGVATLVAPEALKSSPGQCFVGHEQFDLLWHGRKIAGAAQRRRRDGLLIQGSVQPPPVGLDRLAWEAAMCEAGAVQYGAAWQEMTREELVCERAEHLAATKYSQAAHNLRR